MDTRKPTTLRLAVALLAGEAVALAALAGYLLYADVTGEAASLPLALLVTAFVIAAALLLGALARGLHAGRGGGRGAAVAAQLFGAPVAYYLGTGGHPVAGAALAAYLGLALAALIAPPTTAALALERGR